MIDSILYGKIISINPKIELFTAVVLEKAPGATYHMHLKTDSFPISDVSPKDMEYFKVGAHFFCFHDRDRRRGRQQWWIEFPENMKKELDDRIGELDEKVSRS